ncbi:DUF4079 domain-containing protein [Pseudanabaena sp. ABRG5-3]|uniref:DUF4079 domain-containing protein n=1 Tax=Pseudanabaena sp. ABRG5-3 TaxID=685565 RepID=UPI000DC6D84B|nr:DUF4079 domain-containing protein [Pseudanabaena sp. ABRG5-3]BBC25328.1 hypothetical protein ABRG53_3071 [Pseudanabaena sp. ABRG5-3]
MDLKDAFALLHPAIAVVIVFPLIGMVVNRAILVRQRRLLTKAGEKSKIPPIVGSEHVETGLWLSIAVVGVALIGLAFAITSKMIAKDVLTTDPLRVVFVAVMFIVTTASMTFLCRSKVTIWKVVFAVLTSMGLIVIGCQPEVYRLDRQWFISHYYYGVASAILMIISVAIAQDIYKDKSDRWRTAHIILNCLALLLFLGQGITGARDLLDIAPSWQASYLGKCDFTNKACPQIK